MDNSLTIYLLYGLPMALIMFFYILRHTRRRKVHTETWRESVAAGLTEPASLHPVFDPNVCIGSGGCYKACPEQAIGIIDGKGTLISPAHCIGHGACAFSCPVGAIKLVFGTATRGVDIPQVKPNFETNVPGVFIAGELGGMGLIRKAVEQGRQAMETIASRGRASTPHDVVVIGAGPAGIAASLAAKHHGLRCVTLEQEDSLGGTTLHYPRGKLVMTAPMNLPLIGKINIREINKEALLGLWHDVVRKASLKINFGERMERLERQGNAYSIVTNRGSYLARSVLLSIGRRGTPRKLEVPGEELEKVVYRLLDPEQYQGMHVLVVGGGDAAVEAALAIAQQPGATITLSYRSSAFNRIKPKNHELIQATSNSGRVSLLLESNVKEIRPATVRIEQKGNVIELPNDAVIICAGGILPTQLLKEIGVEIETRHGD